MDDEDWARRSQENLGPVTVGRITIFPNPQSLIPDPYVNLIPNPQAIALVIQPSMAFGTGHHATTRLCLAALQMLNLSGTFVLDVGTGSGVLAIAACKLGAEGATGIDNDPDAVRCAHENLALNAGVDNVRFALEEVAARGGWQIARGPETGPPDVVLANLTGELLRRSAPLLAGAFAPGGALIVSGLLAEERDAVVGAFGSLDLVWEMEEDGWVGLGFARLTGTS